MKAAQHLIPFLLLLAAPLSLTAQKSLSRHLRCEVHFFEAHLQLPQGYDKSKDLWLMTEQMHQVFSRPPLASYAYFRPKEATTWQIEVLKPLRLQFPFLQRYEITYLEARLTKLGQAVYRFTHKVNHLNTTEFTLNTLEPVAIFLQHAKTHDEFLHLTCRAD